MKHTEVIEDRKHQIAHSLSNMPKKILQLHGRDNVSEFVLYELGKQANFNLARAAYIVDNPDFDCLKGVVGVSNKELYRGNQDIWDEPDAFSAYMSGSSYNNQVRRFEKTSCIKKGCTDEQTVQEVADHLGFSNPQWYAWDLKYDNHGILLYEKQDANESDGDDLLDGLCLIGFCPIF